MDTIVDNTKRIEWCDLMKGIAIFLVVMGHVYIYSFHQNSGIILSFIYSFHMPLFMFVGGYVAQLKYNKGASLKEFPHYLKNKFIALVVPYIAWSVIVPKIHTEYNWFSFTGILNLFEQSYNVVALYSGHWFLLAFFSLSVGYYLKNCIFTNVKWGGVFTTIILMIIYLIMYKTTGSLLWKVSLQYVPFFEIGCCLCKYDRFMALLSRKQIFNCSFPIFLFIASFYNYNVNNWLKFVVGLVAIPSVLWICMNYHFGSKLNSWLQLLGKQSLAIYCMQGLFFVYFPISFYGSELYQGVVAFILSILITILCVLTTRILEKSSLLNFLLFGKKLSKE